MTEFAIRGPLCIRAEGLCGLLQRTDRAVSMKPISVQHKEREAWGGAPQESLSIFQMLPICYRYWRLAFLKPMGSHWNQMTFIDAQEKKKSSVVKLLWETCPLCDIHHSIYQGLEALRSSAVKKPGGLDLMQCLPTSFTMKHLPPTASPFWNQRVKGKKGQNQIGCPLRRLRWSLNLRKLHLITQQLIIYYKYKIYFSDGPTKDVGS